MCARPQVRHAVEKTPKLNEPAQPQKQPAPLLQRQVLGHWHQTLVNQRVD